MRLNAWLALCLGSSRRECDDLIRSGKVTVGNRAARFDDRVEAGVQVRYRGKVLSPPGFRYIAYNKPAGVITARRDAREATVMDRLGPACRDLFPVGRLDRDSRGLLLLTNDGAWGDRILHPRYGIKKTYQVLLDRDIDVDALKKEIMLEDGPSRFQEVVLTDPRRANQVEVSLLEGRKRQIRRVFLALGFRVIDLVRIRVGDINLARLKEDAWRPLTPREIESVRSHGAKS